jgi:hypothetical protein
LAAVAIVAFGAGWIARRGILDGNPDQPPAGETPATQTQVPPPTDHSELDSLKTALVVRNVFLEPGERLLTDLAADPLVNSEPSAVIAAVPAEARQRASRTWYFRGRRAAARGESTESIGAFQSSVLALGASSDSYWIDDALYELVVLTEASQPSKAEEYARLLLQHHPGSMFNNSVVRDAARTDIP